MLWEEPAFSEGVTAYLFSWENLDWESNPKKVKSWRDVYTLDRMNHPMELTNLLPNTVYSVRLHAMIGKELGDGAEVTITTAPSP